SAGLEAWSLTKGLPTNLVAWLPSTPAGSNSWEVRLPSALAPLSRFPSWIAPGQALFVQSETDALAQPPAPAARISYYHQDHLGSSAVITDGAGMLVEETAFYPSGMPRNQYQAGLSPDPYEFAQKERDAETGLSAFGARYLAGHLARFISVDPKYVNPESLSGQTARDFFAQPQRHNLYAFAGCNPLKYMDEDGLAIVWSRDLQRSKQFQRALQILRSSNEGQRILSALEHEAISVGAGPSEDEHEAGRTHSRTEIQGSDRRGYRRLVTVDINIDLAKA